jgi:hypothetical protein
MEKDETLRREYPGPRRLVRQLLEETQQGDLFNWAEKYGLVNEFFVAINELALVMEGEVAPSDAPKSSDPNAPLLKALVGKRYHINMKKAAWKAFIASIPLALNIFRATVDPTAYIAAGGSFLATIEVFRDNLQRLTPDEVVLYLAVKALNKASQTPPNLSTITAHVNSQVKEGEGWSSEEIEKLLQLMTLKKTMKKDGDGYRTVV